jgi:hypothetical protein
VDTVRGDTEYRGFVTADEIVVKGTDPLFVIVKGRLADS